MKLEFYLSLIILFATLSPEIETSPENGGLSDLHIRKKRIINNNPGENKPVSIRKVPYIVDIRKGGLRNCGGTILAPSIIITAVHCFNNPGTYTVVSGSERLNRGIHHNITKIIISKKFITNGLLNDLAILVISPAIDFENSRNQKIELHDGNIQPNSFGTISGWGCTNYTSNSFTYPDALRSVTVPIISNSECENIYSDYAAITSKLICTYDADKKRGACKGDSGGPLVVNGRLLGVYSWNRDYLRDPDVYTRLSENHNAAWVTATMKMICGH